MMGLINLIAVKVFGEFEFWFALIKVVAIVAMIALGGSVIFFGFTNDWNPIGLSTYGSTVDSSPTVLVACCCPCRWSYLLTLVLR
jgi:L-asparagine transporter-like permease